MGRHSGQIALFASLASREVDCCLIPEIKFKLEGRRGLFEYIRETLSEKGHMVIVVAEGAGIDLVEAGDLGKDKSGNAKLPPIGQYLSDRINRWAEVDEKMEVTLKVLSGATKFRRARPSGGWLSICVLLTWFAFFSIVTA